MRALITGITGQLGPYMAKYLLEKGFEVFGMMRRSSLGVESKLDNLKFVLPDEWEEIQILIGDLTDFGSIVNCLRESNPDFIFNYAAQSHVRESWKVPISTGDVTGLGVMRLLEAIRHFNPEIRLYHSSSSEMFGNSPAPQSETTPFQPVSPYGISKLFAHWSIINYRNSYQLPVCAGIQFNAESPIRGKNFVTRKICSQAVEIYRGIRDKLELGNLEARRDWSFVPDCIEAHFKIISATEPKEYVIGSGEDHSVREFAEEVFNKLGLDFEEYYQLNEEFLRPVELNVLRADISLIKKELGWKPKHKFKDLISFMTDAELIRQGEK